MRRAAVLFLLGGATTMFAQTQEPKPAVQPVERPSLNLKLDNPASFANLQPEAKAEPESLPALGGDARQVPKEKPLQPQNPSSPYPPDTAPGAR
jgi:hypothetical protein